eukprot:TRINITY_DN11623_c0_g1_i1.p1 TRINITY_DN11623_c0_g1~~TRINITY_DN11623_c0_g1_i1.p1  ORF type:complete len:333 (+),score=6.87 TRINITY_DN11623_c0_g1_i1:602-1600(+)
MKAYALEYSISPPLFDEGVRFFSRFENGNLKKVFRVSKSEYELYLDEDYNTTGHYHWFYFKTISNVAVGTVIEFRILNMVKPSSLYSAGFRPFAYSAKGRTGWIPAGSSISYTPTEGHLESLGFDKRKKFYTLRWKYVYEHPNDEVYFAQFVPYSYSDLISQLKSIKEDEKIQSIVRMESLCKTLAGNDCPILTITENVSTYVLSEKEAIIKLKNVKRGNRVEHISYGAVKPSDIIKRKSRQEHTTLETDKEHEKKKAVIITARVHPGNSALKSRRRSSEFLGDERNYCFSASCNTGSYQFKKALRLQAYPNAKSRRGSLRQLPVLSIRLRP